MTTLSPWQGRGPQNKRSWIKRATVALPLLCLLIFGTFIGVRLASSAIGADAASLAPIKGQVPAIVKKSTVLGQTDTNQNLSLSIGLKLRNADSLKAYVDSTSHSKSINAHQHLSQSEIAAAYAPLSSSQQSVIDYMQSYGFQVTSTGKLHLTIGFQGTVGDAENAFHIQINNYRSSKGLNFYAPASDPTVPSDLAALIQNVAGLNNSVTYSHPPISKTKGANPKAVTASSASCPGAGSGYFLPSQIATGYNLNGLYNAGFHGEGQTVGLFELAGFQMSDISTYTNCYGGNHVPINTIAVDENPASPGAGSGEVELDAELILSAAPHLAALNIYEAPNSESGVLDLWSKIITSGSSSVISTSWGDCEGDNSAADLQAENALFTIAAAQGQTIFAASGDSGTNDCLSQNDPNADFLAVDDPASQPYVTGVGGTKLSLNANNSYEQEVVWNEWYNTNQGNYGAGGGGVSNFWPMPSWQQGPGVIDSYSQQAPYCTQATTGYCREVPDVSINADPLTGYVVYTNYDGGAGWSVFGGTSTAAPMWAAFMALTNEKTLHDGGFNIGFINPYLYQIDQNANGTSYANDFHDISLTSGSIGMGNIDFSNDTLQGGNGPYHSSPAYDMATGLGSYNALNLANDLENLANANNGSRQAPAALKWYFAEGSVGGGFTEFLTILNPSNQTANVTVQYLFSNAAARSVSHTVPAHSRYTVSANNDLGIPTSGGHQSISAIVQSTNNVPIVVERPMYMNSGGVNSGSDIAGATSVTNKSFYFAAGNSTTTSSDTFTEFLTILNPNASAVTVTANFYSGGKVVDTEQISVPSLQRGTLIPRSYHGLAAVNVTASAGVVVERPSYSVNSVIPDLSNRVSGAASTVGATAPGTDWLFAEGETGSSYHEDLALANFDTTKTATATVKLEYTTGTVKTVTVTVAPLSQYMLDVNQYKTSSGASNNMAIEVTSDNPIVAERVTYVYIAGSKGPAYMGMTDVVGEPASAGLTTYSFAEGYTAGSYVEWLILVNPNSTAEVVAVTIFADNTIVEKEVTLQPHTPVLIGVNGIVNPIASAYPVSGAQNVSMVVQALSGTVVAERTLYFNVSGTTGETDILGYTGN